MPELLLDGTPVGDKQPGYLIGEIGHNHGGNVENAKLIMRLLEQAGWNAVKLQKRSNRSLYTRAEYDKNYESDRSYGATYGAHREFLEFDRDEYRELQDYANDLRLTFFATPFDRESVDFLEDLNVPLYKIASASITNLLLLEHVAQTGKPLIVSTGGAGLEDIHRAHDAIWPLNKYVALLQCTAAYPCPPEYANLGRIPVLRREFPDAVIGLSDHQNGISLAIAAYAMGARIFEKHVTYSRAAKGTDHGFSLEREGLRKLARDMRRVFLASGNEEQPFDIEREPIRKMAQAVYPVRALSAGETLSEEVLSLKSPGEGLPAWKWQRAMGKKLKRAYGAEEPLSSADWEV